MLRIPDAPPKSSEALALAARKMLDIVASAPPGPLAKLYREVCAGLAELPSATAEERATCLALVASGDDEFVARKCREWIPACMNKIPVADRRDWVLGLTEHLVVCLQEAN